MLLIESLLVIHNILVVDDFIVGLHLLWRSEIAVLLQLALLALLFDNGFVCLAIRFYRLVVILPIKGEWIAHLEHQVLEGRVYEIVRRIIVGAFRANERALRHGLLFVFVILSHPRFCNCDTGFHFVRPTNTAILKTNTGILKTNPRWSGTAKTHP